FITTNMTTMPVTANAACFFVSSSGSSEKPMLSLALNTMPSPKPTSAMARTRRTKSGVPLLVVLMAARVPSCQAGLQFFNLSAGFFQRGFRNGRVVVEPVWERVTADVDGFDGQHGFGIFQPAFDGPR